MKYIEKLLQGAEVEWHILGDVAEYIRGITYNKSAEIDKGDGWKVLRANNIILTSRKLVLDDIKLINKDIRVRDKQHLYKNDILICAGSGSKEHIGKSAYIDEDIDYVFGGFMGVVRTKRSILNSRYLFHYLGSSAFYLYLEKTLNSSTINNLNSSIMNFFPIPIPPLSVQEEIVRILDKFTTLEAELEAELDCRKRQYEYYRNQLLSFDMLNRGGQKVNNVIWLKMGDIAEIYGGLTGKSKVDFGIGDAYFIPYKNIFDHSAVKLDKLEKVRVDVGERQHKVKYGDVLFTGSSETPEEVGMSSSVTTEPQSNVYLNSFCFGVRFNEGIELMPEFSKFLFRSPIMRRQIYKTASGVTRFNVSKERFKKILIPIPPLSEQQRIVSILDKFDTLTTSISEGLPKEIELRRKQYEYYRNELLSFSKPKVIS